MPPVLIALQTIFTTPELNKKIFLLLEEKICAGKKNRKAGNEFMAHISIKRSSPCL